MAKSQLLSVSVSALAGALVLLPAAALGQATGRPAGKTDTSANPAGVATPEEKSHNGLVTAPAVENAGGSADAIVVTGSRIARPNLDSAVPITSISVQELTSTGNVSIGDALNQLPALRSTFSQSNSTRFIGTAGINALDLRGLGTARTLVLVDGRRIVTATPGVERVDTNIIPTDLIERVDLVTGGNSAIYGSDAVAGVVNFVLKRNFDGIRVRGQGGITTYGDRGSYFTSLTAGHNFGEGRGNIAVAFEYAKENPLYYTDRDERLRRILGSAPV